MPDAPPQPAGDAPTVAYETARRDMVRWQLRARGLRDERVLAAMAAVPREAFVPDYLREFAYDDCALPIEMGQTISQPFIVAFMTEALELTGGERVLEIGTGSGYAAAVLATIAGEVYTIELHERLVELAQARLSALGYDNVHVIHADGTRGWPVAAPYDAIVVTAGGPAVPASLREQLAVGGRLVLPVGRSYHMQQLLRVRRVTEGEFTEEPLLDVRFVPLVGEEGWPDTSRAPHRVRTPRDAIRVLRRAAHPFAGVDTLDPEPLLNATEHARVVLLGAATHGTSEFQRLRARLTRALIERRGFRIVALEADWPDAARMDAYVRGREPPDAAWTTGARFPAWLWRNAETRAFLDGLRAANAGVSDAGARVAVYGLDLYSLYTSIEAVLAYLDSVDVEAARRARERYACLTPWQADPAAYGRAVLGGRFRSCERDVAAMLADLSAQRARYARADGDRFLDAAENARLVADAERYYADLFYARQGAWNRRARHMFDTLQAVRAFHGPDAKVVVWAHNAHVGNATATDLAARGRHSLGQLCREHLGPGAFLLGLGAHRGRVAAATAWNGPVQVLDLPPADEQSYEQLCHETGHPAFWTELRDPKPDDVRRALLTPRLERAIGVVYRPEDDAASHYMRAILPEQFDAYVWFDETGPVKPLPAVETSAVGADLYPFGV